MTCPNREQLLAYLRDQAGPDLTEHVEACPVCQAELERMEPLEDTDLAPADRPGTSHSHL